jgi:Mrp family chromosome partitioning ATPase
MGKLMETLRQAPPRRTPPDEDVRLNAPPGPDVEDPAAEEEVPFIEVGPHRSLEASPSVLAAVPTPDAPPTPEPTGVVFRASHAESLPRRPHFAPDIIAHHQPDHPVSGQYRELLGALTPPTTTTGSAILLLSPAVPSADAGGVLLNLAVTAARKGGRRVIVVDAGMNEPTLAERLGLSARPGLAEVLAGAATLEQALQPTGQANLAVLTAGGPPPAGPRLVVETPASLLRLLRQSCGLALVLGPHWEGRPEAAAVAASCDVVYLVMPERDAGLAKVDELVQAIPRLGARFGGFILAA